MTRFIVVFVAIASGGCMRSTAFHCETNEQCGADGLCEPDQFCSFPSSECASGRAYGESSGPQSSQCVGAAGVDAGPGMPGDAAGGEPPAPACPSGYAALPNAGPRNHVYKLRTALATWSQHRDACAAEGTFLAFPDGATAADARLELAALRALAGNAAWVGVNDIQAEGQYRTSLNQPVSAATQSLIMTAGNPSMTDCLVINNTTLDDTGCNTTHPAVCECVP